MITSLPEENLAAYIERQIECFFPDGGGVSVIRAYATVALERLEFCFKHINAKYFRVNGQSRFDHLNGDQYAMFLYLLANEISKNVGPEPICDKLFGLNKLLHGIDCFYQIELPPVFLFSHPVGTVLGRAEYSDFLLVYQNCTVGSNHRVHYPIIGRNVALYKGSAVLGHSHIGDNCKIAADATVLDTDVPTGSIYFGQKNNYTLKPFTKADPVWDQALLGV